MDSSFPIYSGKDCWDPALEPTPNTGWRSEDMELLDNYLARVKPLVGHLPRQVVEQWIYRHYRQTKFRNISLENLTAKSENWTSEDILSIGSADTREMLRDELDRHSFFRKWGTTSAKAFKETGTWDFPLLIMAHDDGFLDRDGSQTPYKHWLIEGHKRFRLLNYWHHQGKANDLHEVWVLKFS